LIRSVLCAIGEINSQRWDQGATITRERMKEWRSLHEEPEGERQTAFREKSSKARVKVEGGRGEGATEDGGRRAEEGMARARKKS
jgi:hypothetical protein